MIRISPRANDIFYTTWWHRALAVLNQTTIIQYCSILLYLLYYWVYCIVGTIILSHVSKWYHIFKFFCFKYHKFYFFLFSTTSSIFCFRLKYLKHIRSKWVYVPAEINIFLVYFPCKHPIKQPNHLICPIQ